MNINQKIEKIEQEISVLEHMLAWEKMTINSTYGVKFSDVFEIKSKKKNKLIGYKKNLNRLKKYKQINENNINT